MTRKQKANLSANAATLIRGAKKERPKLLARAKLLARVLIYRQGKWTEVLGAYTDCRGPKCCMLSSTHGLVTGVMVKYVRGKKPTQPRYICVYGIPGAVQGANTVEDLERYLSEDPHPEYRLASCQYRNSGLWHMVWERIRR